MAVVFKADGVELEAAARLAFKREGRMWNAYVCRPDSMKDCILLASVSLRMVESEMQREFFIAFIREGMNGMLQADLGIEAAWGEVVPSSDPPGGNA